MMKSKVFVYYYTLALIITSFLGSKILAINIGPQLSLCRILFLLSPIILFLEKRNNFEKRRISKYTSFLLFWSVYAFCSVIFVKDSESFFRLYFFLLLGLACSYFCCNNIKNIHDVKIILVGFETIAILFSLVGIYEIVTGDYRFVNEQSVDWFESRSMMESTIGIREPVSVFANPNDFGLFLLFAFCVSTTLFCLSSTFKGKLFNLIVTILTMIMIVLVQSRAAFLSLLIGLAILLIDFYKQRGPIFRLLFIIFIIISFSSITGWLIANQDLYYALVEFDVASGGSDTIRIDLIKNGWIFLINSAFCGVGLGNIEYHMLHNAVYNTGGTLNIHNWWMEVLVSSGIFVFIWYISVYLRTYRFFIKKMRDKRNKQCYYIVRMGVMMMSVFIIGSISSSSIFPMEWIWALFAVLFALPTIVRNELSVLN